MGLSKFYKMDADAVLNGKWVPWHSGELKVARSNNERAEKLKKRLMAPFDRPGMRSKRPSDEQQKAILVEVLAYGILLDWRDVELDANDRSILRAAGIDVPDEGEVAYTPEIGKALLLAYEDFREDLVQVSTNEELYRAADLEEDQGKS